MTTTSTKPTARETSAMVRDGSGLRPVVATLVGSMLELRAKGRRKSTGTYSLGIADLYYQAVKQDVAEKKLLKTQSRKRK